MPFRLSKCLASGVAPRPKVLPVSRFPRQCFWHRRHIGCDMLVSKRMTFRGALPGQALPGRTAGAGLYWRAHTHGHMLAARREPLLIGIDIKVIWVVILHIGSGLALIARLVPSRLVCCGCPSGCFAPGESKGILGCRKGIAPLLGPR